MDEGTIGAGLNIPCEALGRGAQKKTPEVFPPSGVNPLDYSTHSPSSWRSPVWSRRTVKTGSGDRSVFGCPQAIKKAAGNAANEGR